LQSWTKLRRYLGLILVFFIPHLWQAPLKRKDKEKEEANTLTLNVAHYRKDIYSINYKL
jgi:hypothetical protein